MKDIHSHILYEIDDGADDIKESIDIIKNAINGGYTDIILTPHYRKRQGYIARNKVKFELFNKLLDKVKEENLNINLYLGNEITVDEDLFYYLKTDQVLTLNRSRYILLELSFTGRLKYLDDVFSELLDKNYIPIIPHPERYKDYNIEDYIKWIDKGILFQGNIESLYGNYGKKAKTKLENMLKRHMIHFLGSDIHKSFHDTYNKKTVEMLDNILNDHEMSLELTDKNIDKVINNKEIKPYKVIEDKKKFKLFKH